MSENADTSVPFSHDINGTEPSESSQTPMTFDREDPARRETGVLDSLIAPIIVVDRNGTIMAVNKAWNRFVVENFYRTDSASADNSSYAIGGNYYEICTDVYGDGAAPTVAAGLRSVLEGNRERFTLEYVQHASDAQRWYQVTITAMDPEVEGAAIAHFNVTESVELRQANEILDAFAQSLVLAFRTPLGNMRESLDALIAHPFPPQLRSDFEQLNENAGRLDSMVRDLLAYSRINRSSVVLHPTDMQHSIAEALHRMSTEIRRRKAVVTVADSFPNIMADPVLLTEAVSCLLSNALKFTAPGMAPRINIYVENGPDAVSLWVEDHGIGVDVRDISSIFTIFGRAEASTIYPGNGIGLAIVYRIMKHMGGSVEVLPHSEGGSRFKLVFPKRAARRKR